MADNNVARCPERAFNRSSNTGLITTELMQSAYRFDANGIGGISHRVDKMSQNFISPEIGALNERESTVCAELRRRVFMAAVHRFHLHMTKSTHERRRFAVVKPDECLHDGALAPAFRIGFYGIIKKPVEGRQIVWDTTGNAKFAGRSCCFRNDEVGAIRERLAQDFFNARNGADNSQLP